MIACSTMYAGQKKGKVILMKKNIFYPSILAFSLLLGGCANVPAQSESTISNQDFSSLHEQLDTLQVNMSHYMKTPSASDYKILTETEIKTSMEKLSSELLLQLDNLTDVSYQELNISIIFYDEDNQLLNNASAYVDNLLAGKTSMLSVYCPTDKENQILAYDHYELQIKALPIEGEVTDYSDQVSVISNPMDGQGVIAKFTNDSDVTLNNVSAYVIYRDAEGTILDCETYFMYDLLPGGFETATFSTPFDANYDPLPYEDYTLVVASAVNTEEQFRNTPQQPRPLED